MRDETHVPITAALDIVTARQQGRALAMELGFESSEVTLIAAAISEVSRNIVEYAGTGEIVLRTEANGSNRGLCIIARDRGPGIADIAQAMQYGYSSRRGLGVGLPGAKLLMDDFDIVSEVGKGTTITMKKWLAPNASLRSRRPNAQAGVRAQQRGSYPRPYPPEVEKRPTVTRQGDSSSDGNAGKAGVAGGTRGEANSAS